MLDGFPNLQSSIIYNNKLIEIIDQDAFSNLKQLTSLDLSKHVSVALYGL